MERTLGEQSQLDEVRHGLTQLAAFLRDHPVPNPESPVAEWYAYLAAIKAIVGNASNDLSFVACLMAKAYLCRLLPMRPFDVALKSQSANGLDIDARTMDDQRVIAEIKTTTPVLGNNFGAAQKASFARDFAKLARAEAPHKFLFVTNLAAYEVLRHRHTADLPGVKLVFYW